MKRSANSLLAIVAALLLPGMGMAQDGYAPEYKKLLAEYNAAWKEFFRPELEAKTVDESEKIKFDRTRKNPYGPFRPRFRELAQRAGKSQTGYEAWKQVFTMSRYKYPGGIQDCNEALSALMRDFIQSPLMASFPELLPDAYMSLGRQGQPKKVDGLLLQIEKKSRVPAVKASALEARGDLYYRDDPELAKRLFRDVIKKYPGTGGAQEARLVLFKMEDLVAGKLAPDFQAIDQDGHKFKLSDYRGKVVVLDFWAFWCIPCCRLLPHEEAMVEKYKDKPFAVVGVDCGDERARFNQKWKEQGLHWQNAMDDGKPLGPIQKAWQVGAWPTVYIIDAKGIIRHKVVGEDAAEIEKSVADALGVMTH